MLVNKDAYQRVIFTEWLVRLPLTFGTHNRLSNSWKRNTKIESQQLTDSYTKWAHDRCLGYSALTAATTVSPNMRDFANVTLSRRHG